MKLIHYLLFFVLGTVALHAAEKKPDVDTSAVMKIVVHADGGILVDGTRTNLSELPAKLAALAQKKGVVWFYRANPGGKPPANAREVIKMVVDAKRPIQMFTKEDFSETIGRDGKPKKVK